MTWSSVAPDPRPSFVGDLSDAEVAARVARLRADPAWVVLEPFDRAPERLIQLVHRPTGAPYAVRAVRSARGWRFLPPPVAVA